MDNSASFTNSSGGYKTLLGGDYTPTPHHDPSAGFSVDVHPASGETMPRAFPGSGLYPTATTGVNPGWLVAFGDINPASALYSSRDSSKDCLGSHHGQSSGPFDTSCSFLPSLPGAGANGTTVTCLAIFPKQAAVPIFGGDGDPRGGNSGAANKQRVARKKRRRHSTPVISTTDKDENAPNMLGGSREGKEMADIVYVLINKSTRLIRATAARTPPMRSRDPVAWDSVVQDESWPGCPGSLRESISSNDGHVGWAPERPHSGGKITGTYHDSSKVTQLALSASRVFQSWRVSRQQQACSMGSQIALLLDF